MSLFKLLFIKKKKKGRRKGGKSFTTRLVRYSVPVSLPPSARVTEYYSVSFRERKGGTRLKGWWVEGEGGRRRDVGKLYINSEGFCFLV